MDVLHISKRGRTHVGVDPAYWVRKHGVKIRGGVEMEAEHVSQSKYRDEETGLDGTTHDAVDERVGLAETSTGVPQGPAEGDYIVVI